MTTLLEKAKSVKVGRNYGIDYTPEMLELSFAFLNDEITLSQLTAVLCLSPNNGSSAAHKALICLKKAMKAGDLKVEIVKKN